MKPHISFTYKQAAIIKDALETAKSVLTERLDKAVREEDWDTAADTGEDIQFIDITIAELIELREKIAVYNREKYKS